MIKEPIPGSAAYFARDAAMDANHAGFAPAKTHLHDCAHSAAYSAWLTARVSAPSYVGGERRWQLAQILELA